MTSPSSVREPRGHGPRGSWRGAAGALVSVCAVFAAALGGNPAVADNPTPSSSAVSPANSTSVSTPHPSLVDTTQSSSQSSSVTKSQPPPTTSKSSDYVTPTVALTPNHGRPGDPFQATATGFGRCGSMSFQWDDGVGLKSMDVNTEDSIVASLQVPASAKAGRYQVSVSCGRKNASKPFVVEETLPTLTLQPEKNDPQKQVTATVTRFRACLSSDSPRDVAVPALSLWWDTTMLRYPNPTTVNGDQDLQLQFSVPADASVGEHQVTLGCATGPLRAIFTVTAPETPSLAVTPAQGAPGMSAVATPTGFGECDAISFRWDRNPLPTSRVDGNTLAVNFAVPEDAPAGDHDVTAACGNESARATVTVVPAIKPTLTLDNGHGPAGLSLKASGSGFACGDGDVTLFWDSQTRLTDASFGMFSAVPLTIPLSAPTGDHTVRAACQNHPDIAAIQHFTVTSATLVTGKPATLVLAPTSGHPGDSLHATGDGFPCADNAGPVDLSWDDGTPLPRAFLHPPGHFDASLSVPTTTDAGRITLRATCADGVVLAADFTVLTTPAQHFPKILWLLIGLIVAGAVGAAAQYVRRRRHNRHRASPHVQVVPHADGSSVVTLRETPERDEATHALRLQAHSGARTVTVREVEDDHTAE